MRKLLEHARTNYKITAVEALAAQKDAPSIPAITAFLSHENADLRRASLNALVVMNARGCSGAIAARMESAEGLDYYVCASALIRLRAPEAVPVLLRMLESPDAERVARSLKWLPTLKAAEAIPRLKKLLTHEAPKVRAAAASALARLVERSAIPDIRKLLSDEDDEVRAEAIGALGALEAREARKDLLPFLKKRKEDEEMDLAYDAIQALGQMKDKESVPDLLPFLESYDYRETAFDALCSINDPSTHPALLKLLDDVEHSLRLTAVRSFGQMKLVAAVPALLALLKDEERDLRTASVQALGKIATPEAIQGATSALGDRRRECKTAALRVVQERGVTSAIPEVAKLLKDPNEEIRRLAADVLGWLGSKEGARVALDGRWALTGLNFLRRPEAARKLKSVRMKRLEEGTNAGLLDRIAKAGGTTWKSAPAANPKLAEWLRRDCTWPDGDDEMNLMEILDGLVKGETHAVVVESECFVIMSRSEAVALFEAWLAESK